MNIPSLIIAVSTACSVAAAWDVSAVGTERSSIYLKFTGLTESFNVTLTISSGGSAGCIESTYWGVGSSRRLLVWPKPGSDEYSEEIKGLKSFTRYKFQVDDKTVLGTTQADPKPKPVQNLRVSESLPTKFTVSWDQYSCQSLTAEFKRFELYVNDEENRRDFTNTLTDTSLTASGLDPLTLYTAAVQINLNEKTRQTIQVCTGTQGGPGVGSVAERNLTSVVFQWNKPQSYSINVHKLNFECGVVNLTATILNETTVQVSGLKHSTTHTCRAQIYNTEHDQKTACGNPQELKFTTRDFKIHISNNDGEFTASAGENAELFARIGKCPNKQEALTADNEWKKLNKSSPYSPEVNSSIASFICFYAQQGEIFKYQQESLTVDNSDGDKGSPGPLPQAAIIGIIVAVLVLVLVVVAVVIYRRKNSQKQYSKTATSDVELAEAGNDSIKPNGKDTKGASNGAGEGLYDSVDAPRPQPAPRPQQPAPRSTALQMFGYEAVDNLELEKESNQPEADQRIINEYSTPKKILKLINEPTDEEEPEDE